MSVVRCRLFTSVANSSVIYVYTMYVSIYMYIPRYLIYIGLVLKRRNVGHGIVRLGKVGKVRTVR